MLYSQPNKLEWSDIWSERSNWVALSAVAALPSVKEFRRIAVIRSAIPMKDTFQVGVDRVASVN